MSLTQTQLSALTLARTSGIGPITYHSLLNLFPTPEEALHNLSDLCKSRGRKILTPPAAHIIDQEVEKTLSLGASFLFYHEDAYPQLLKETPDAPPVLITLGNPLLLQEKQVAIVGNRNASIHGKTFTQELATALADHNITTTSGLARGVDTAAHQASLIAGHTTIAAIAGGINHIYPPENKNLRESIIEKGCIVTESPFGETPTARHFPRRNRIIAGLSIATVVTEAARHSGSLITTQYAGEYGRDVFAVPGNPKDSRAAGPNHLLAQGAQILLSPDQLISMLPQNMSQVTAKSAQATLFTREAQSDLFDDLPHQETSTPNIPEKETEQISIETQLKNALTSTPLPQDALIRQLKISETQALALLSELELMGDIQRHPGNQWSL